MRRHFAGKGLSCSVRRPFLSLRPRCLGHPPFRALATPISILFISPAFPASRQARDFHQTHTIMASDKVRSTASKQAFRVQAFTHSPSRLLIMVYADNRCVDFLPRGGFAGQRLPGFLPVREPSRPVPRQHRRNPRVRLQCSGCHAGQDLPQDHANKRAE